MRIEKAAYQNAILPEHQGNPLIEALPPKKGWEELMIAFSHYPDYAEHICQHPDPLVREEYLSRIKELRQPLHDYYECFRAVERAIKNGYSSKSPFSPTTAQYLHYLVDERPDIEPRTGFFQPRGDGLTLIGESGVGKTSMLEQILNYFPNVIEHESYNNQFMELDKQVVWIKVDCPNNSSVRDLCEEILASLDLSLGREKTKPAGTIGALVRQIEQNIKSSFLGILVIDEMQRLVFKRTGGENNLLNFLHSLVNKLGVPIFFCANPPFDDTLARTLKAARRAESGGYFVMEVLERDSDAWEAFVEELWKYQWTNNYTELTQELNNKLYELSVGNMDMACRTYREAQRAVIGTCDETITAATLEMGYALACGLSSKTEEVRSLKSVRALPRGKSRAPSNQQQPPSASPAPRVDRTGDITKPQHPEFAKQLIDILGIVDLHEKIQDTDLFQRAGKSDNPLEYLRRNDALLDDPLQSFACK
ncbi:AAA family ATPase [Vibrio breoganii]|uniref:AAA family ATPase n=2 Tax=Vibrio TaxID=662 RepID=UPI0010BE0B56|nr:AAA family ATPase [Vibrio sp. F13]TKF45565.1 AAA family ATPase [Vibrio sp. F13]